ncbi:MAG TPA: STAS domain-containing protein [Vicinamibacteria bacterium]|nr:STAS domain-containing protein [Vicinamibacteria bacterium]
MGELTVETRHLEGVTLLYPRGFINAHNVRLFESELQRVLEQGQFKLVVNCADLAYIASAGLGAIMGAIEEIRDHGGDLRLAGLNATVLNIFEILGMHRLYRIFASEAEAIQSFLSLEGPAA